MPLGQSIIYRPPREARTPLLPVTEGCSHNRCSFCNMYRDVPFRLYPDAVIDQILTEIQTYAPDTNRIYLVGGDPFVLSADRLKHIIQLIRQKLPRVETITMYASINNIKTKTDEDLQQLRDLGVNQLYIGLETGDDALLKALQKGSTRQDAIDQLNRLTAAQITYGVIIMTGLAGRGKGIANAMATADVMNQVQARVLYCNSLVVMPDTPLGQALAAGKFKEASEYERIEELLTLFRHLKPKSKLLVNSYHASNALNINAEVPDEAEIVIQRLSTFLKQTTPEDLQLQFDRKQMRI